MSTKVLLVIVLSGVASVSGCAGVKPYEREFLAQDAMQFGAHPESDALREHVFQYREGSVGGYDGHGGGCGCN